MNKSKSLKLAVAIAGENALPSAFVVFRGFEISIQRAAELGYDGVELALKSAEEVESDVLARQLEQAGLEVSCISTGQVFAQRGLMFTDADTTRREELRSVFIAMINLAERFGGMVNIGRVRGRLDADPAGARQRFIDMARELCDYAIGKNVTLILEPVNRYEIDFINSVAEGAELMAQVDRPNMKLMPDVFHMNIEDAAIGSELKRCISDIAYIHLADSNRRAPGWGHTDFEDIFRNLREARYHGWVSAEILPIPDPNAAAAQAAGFLRPMIDKYNQTA
ncbi:MAG: sugar phosphate isomerase/epimerase [Sedimentisphaerales bacterium]|nr:sugar phosphate isomerase/epimerase [Sedimentisphaerales bacterium]